MSNVSLFRPRMTIERLQKELQDPTFTPTYFFITATYKPEEEGQGLFFQRDFTTKEELELYCENDLSITLHDWIDIRQYHHQDKVLFLNSFPFIPTKYYNYILLVAFYNGTIHPILLTKDDKDESSWIGLGVYRELKMAYFFEEKYVNLLHGAAYQSLTEEVVKQHFEPLLKLDLPNIDPKEITNTYLFLIDQSSLIEGDDLRPILKNEGYDSMDDILLDTSRNGIFFRGIVNGKQEIKRVTGDEFHPIDFDIMCKTQMSICFLIIIECAGQFYPTRIVFTQMDVQFYQENMYISFNPPTIKDECDEDEDQ